MKKKLLFICLFIIKCSYGQTLLGGMPLPNGSVYSLEKIDNTVYIGGTFSQVNTIPHDHLASFDATTGTLSSWSPTVSGNVTSLTRVGNKLIAGGSFTSVNLLTRYGIAMFDLSTGNLDSWSDTANYPSWRQGVAAYNNTFYYCRINTPSSVRVVCVDALTGNFTPWQSDSALSGDINAIYASGNYVYVGGVFNFSGGSTIYDDLCRFSQLTGALDTSWHPQPAIINFGITAIVKTNAHIFVGGDFNVINGVSRKGVAAYDDLSGNLSSFNQNSSSYEVISLYADGNYIWVGGNSSTLGGQLRYRIAQIRISNSSATCWNASATSNAWSTVQSILVSNDTVYTGPIFGSPALSVFGGTPLPQPSGDTISGPDSVIASQVVTYSVPFVSGHTYNWSVTGGTGSSTTNSINVTWGPGPGGTVRVVENNPSYTNCYSDTITLQVFISISTTAAGLDNSEDGFLLLPTPATDYLIIELPPNISASEFKIFNLLGETKYHSVASHQKNEIDISGLAKGIYIIQVAMNDKMSRHKFIKQ